MADNERRDPLQAQSGGPQQSMEQGGGDPSSMQQQQDKPEGEEQLTGGGQGQAYPAASGQSAPEMSQSDAGFGSSAAVKQGGLGAQQTSYGQSTQQDATGGLGSQSVNTGAQGQTGVLGKSPGHDKNLSTGLKDQNQGGTSGGGL